MLLSVYAVGVLLSGARLLYGWVLASARIRRARRGGPIRVDVADQVYQSSEVTVPMTVGAIRPVIVLPVTWNTWDLRHALAAIVAHEATHVRRGDASINVAAHLNRAIFWFHPLAWWLERKLAVTAEHACDEAAARAIGAPGRYAEILVEMADVVRHNRGASRGRPSASTAPVSSTAASIACSAAMRSPSPHAGRKLPPGSGASSPLRR